MLLTKQIWIGHTRCERKERHTKTRTQLSQTQARTHTGWQKQAFIHCQGCAALFIPPLPSETYASAAVEGWCTPRELLHPFNIHQTARLGQPASLTFIGQSDSIVHHIVITYIGSQQCVSESIQCVPSHADELYLFAASTDLKLWKAKMPPCSQRNPPAV